MTDHTGPRNISITVSSRTAASTGTYYIVTDYGRVLSAYLDGVPGYLQGLPEPRPWWRRCLDWFRWR